MDTNQIKEALTNVLQLLSSHPITVSTSPNHYIDDLEFCLPHKNKMFAVKLTYNNGKVFLFRAIHFNKQISGWALTMIMAPDYEPVLHRSLSHYIAHIILTELEQQIVNINQE